VTREDDALTTNLVAAFGLLLADTQYRAVERVTGLPGGAAAALVVVGHAPGQTIDFLRRVLDRSHSTVVRQVASLAERGLLERSAGEDGRVVSLTLTPAGRKVVRTALAERRRAVAERLEVLGVRDRRTLRGLVSRVLTDAVDDEVSAFRICRMCDGDACLEGECPVEQAFDQGA
jgi:DNA-binding MarR family transcriptional regulator